MYYFETEENQKKLFEILESWLNTPFRHKCCVKGLGCDCIHFLGGVFAELKLCVVDRVKVPNYPKDWHLHNTRELLSEGLETEFNVEKIDLNAVLMDGDIILSHYGKASSHAGIYFKEYVYQSIDKIGVKKIHFNDRKFRKQMKFVYRLLEDQNKGSNKA